MIAILLCVFFQIPAIAQNKGARVECVNGQAAGFECLNVDILAHMTRADLSGKTDPFGNPQVDFVMNDMWGWYDESSEREFLLVGRTDGTAFVEVTDQENPVYLGFLPQSGSRASIWRDMKVYQNYAYIVADGASTHGVQVFNLEKLLTAPPGQVDFQMDNNYNLVASVHNIVINEETGFAYAVGSRSGGTTCGGGLHMINLQNPSDPSFAGCYAQVGTGRSNTGYTHDAQCVVYRGQDEDWNGKELCFSSNETAIVIADVTDKNNPTTVSIGSYPATQYTHQGWISEDQNFFFVGDELDENNGAVTNTRTLVWDISDLDDPVLADEFFADRTTIDHNMYVRGNLLFQSQYIDGLRILDITDPENMQEVAFFDTEPDNPTAWDGSWSNYPYLRNGAVAVTDTYGGLFILQPTVGLAVANEKLPEIPETIAAYSFYPNPFKGSATLQLQLKTSEYVSIDLIDILGRRVENLFAGQMEARSQTDVPVRVSGIPGGVYAIRVTGESFEYAQTVLHTK